ncbi:hypothetical protein [Burkholderia ubonensis]|uniref:hypothetical protein n=1 Tax=Burkholderia ubonensis TaxID=101571 RepID=UPI00075E2C76|nr:hypothetical protein [Burkholderia ubonensis]AOI68729.1 hypothetical protein WI31_03610 [Burkholderia ubonensis]KUZ17410.1 hypothetical protein WI29_17940 [Burkholderia ubonensis]KUZ31186.1 hypothetical protein WI32_00965 [Burkholderia ubonensis]KUZ37958.1 hypothetical protein WI30_04725 [Burkholderia ubonensis]KUZ39958.1 hypothetical protein WI33_34440 [Burkholderia ubonensis]
MTIDHRFRYAELTAHTERFIRDWLGQGAGVSRPAAVLTRGWFALSALVVVVGLPGCMSAPRTEILPSAEPFARLLDRVGQLAASDRLTDIAWVSATLGCAPVPAGPLEGAERTQLVHCPAPVRAGTRPLYTLRQAAVPGAATVELNLGPFDAPPERATVLAQLAARFGPPSCPYTLPAIGLCLYGPTVGRPATVSVLFQEGTLSGLTVLGGGPLPARP